jgi:hypothetical protein
LLLLGAFSDADVNGDGELSFAESQAVVHQILRTQFSRIDTDNSQLLSELELRAAAGLLDAPSGCECSKAMGPDLVRSLFSNLTVALLSGAFLVGFVRKAE